MLDGFVIRGTTPTHDFELPYAKELIDDIRITYGQGGKPIFTKTKSSCQFEDQVVKVTLTQSETLLFSPRRNVEIELKIKFSNGMVIQSEELITLRVVDTMYNEEFK